MQTRRDNAIGQLGGTHGALLLPLAKTGQLLGEELVDAVGGVSRGRSERRDGSKHHRKLVESAFAKLLFCADNAASEADDARRDDDVCRVAATATK